LYFKFTERKIFEYLRDGIPNFSTLKLDRPLTSRRWEFGWI